jgi:hypothetical protein
MKASLSTSPGPKEKIAVLLEPDGDDAAELEDSGWTLVSATVDTVTSALVERGAEPSSALISDSRSEDGNGDRKVLIDEHHDAQEHVQDGEVHQKQGF